MQQAFHGKPRRDEPQLRLGFDRADRFDTVERLTQYAASKAGGGGVWLPRANAHGRQSHRAAIDEAFARIIAHQEFADQFLNAVGALRYRRGCVSYDLR